MEEEHGTIQLELGDSSPKKADKMSANSDYVKYQYREGTEEDKECIATIFPHAGFPSCAYKFKKGDTVSVHLRLKVIDLVDNGKGDSPAAYELEIENTPDGVENEEIIMFVTQEYLTDQGN